MMQDVAPKVIRLGKQRYDGAWKRRLAQGLCGECGQEPYVPGRQRGRLCSAKRHANYKARREKAIEENRCLTVGCGEPIDKNARCVQCREKTKAGIRKYRQHRLANGCCEYCGSHLSGRKKVCDECCCKRLAKTHTGDRENWPQLMALFKEQGGRCAFTGIPIEIGVNASIDHIVPRGKSGANAVENFQWVHICMNVLRRNIDEAEFMVILEEFLSTMLGTPWVCPKRPHPKVGELAR